MLPDTGNFGYKNCSVYEAPLVSYLLQKYAKWLAKHFRLEAIL